MPIVHIPPSGPFCMTLNLSETALLSIVIPRCCSSSLLSRYLIFPAIRVEMILFAARRASIMVVFPWSTWPIVVTLRTSTASGAAMIARVENVFRREIQGLLRMNRQRREAQSKSAVNTATFEPGGMSLVEQFRFRCGSEVE